MYLLTATGKSRMSDSNVIPFRRRESKPSMSELEVYQRMTRNWSQEMRQLMFPTHFEIEEKAGRPKSE